MNCFLHLINVQLYNSQSKHGLYNLLCSKFKQCGNQNTTRTDRRLIQLTSQARCLKNYISKQMGMPKVTGQSDYNQLTFLVWMVNSTSSLSRSSSFIFASEKWKKISFTTSARSMNPKLSFMEQTTPWYFTGCAGFSSRIWQAPKLPLLHRQSGQPKEQLQAAVLT